MSGVKRTKAEVWKRAFEMLRMAEYAAADTAGADPTKWRAGAMNVAVYGRAVTGMVEGLRPIEAGFDDWFKPRTAEMNKDPLMRFFYVLRSSVLKEGDLPTTVTTDVNHLDSKIMSTLMNDAPAGTEELFFGDELGGNGWKVRLPDGSMTKVYFKIPEEVLTSQVNFENPPTEHNGQPITDHSVANLCRLYVRALRRFLNDAIKHFGRE